MFESKYQQLMGSLKGTTRPVSYIDATIEECQDDVSNPISTFNVGLHLDDTAILDWLRSSSESGEQSYQSQRQVARIRLL